jgi:uncharacterized membrane protein YeaQ/YmgE (transglycosylase-associated protein family)
MNGGETQDPRIKEAVAMGGDFSFWHLVWFVILGGFVGWLAGVAVRRRGFGCLGNVAAGGLFFLPESCRFGGLGDNILAYMHPFGYAVLVRFAQFICYAILGGFVGWLAGLALRGRGLGCPGIVSLIFVGAVAGGLFFLLGLRFFGSLIFSPLFFAIVGVVSCLAFVIILARRR